MAEAASTSKYFLLFILSTLTISSYGNNLKSLSHDTIFPPPFTPPPDNIPVPTIVTVPATNPVTVTPTTTTTNPASTPLPIIPSSTPPAPTAVPAGGQPIITNPVTTYPAPTGNAPVTNPVVAPPAVTGQSWCVAKTGASESAVQSALDYACGLGGADCSLIQQGGSCYNPSTLQNHASFAFNSYYQKNPSPTSCDFGGTAYIVNTNPSTGTCIYPSSSTPSSTTPTPPTPPTPTTIPPPATTIPPPATTIPAPATTITSPGPVASGSVTVTPPSVLNSSNPALVFGSESPPVTNTSISSVSSGWQWQPFIACFTLVAGIIIPEM